VENWRSINEFPDYSISDNGRVVNTNTGRIMALTRNQRGIVMVGLMKSGIQHKRSVPVLVLEAFHPKPMHQSFDSHIHLDGDRTNNIAENLMRRPTWFAVKYHQQFWTGHSPHVNQPIMDIKTREVYDNSMHAATIFGLLDREIQIAIMNSMYVWPTYQTFLLHEE